jgi:beta-lactamase class A
MATVEGQTMMHFILSLVIASLLFSCPCLAGEPANHQNRDFPALWQSQDSILQQKLENLVRQQGLWGKIKSKHLALAVVDLSDLQNPRLAELNGNQMYYAASLPKIAILLGVFVEIEAGSPVSSHHT